MTCGKCQAFFSRYRCSAQPYGECDCPKCQGLCECERITVNIGSQRWLHLLREEQIAAHAKRLALELECLLLSCNNASVAAKHWSQAHDALHDYNKTIAEVYSDNYVSPLGKH
jgi:hypothetical protein